MKFAKQLALKTIPAWAVYYLDYKELKRIIRQYQETYKEDQDTSKLETIINDFRKTMKNELSKIDNRFTEVYTSCEKNLKTLKTSSLKILNEEPNEQTRQQWKSEMSVLIQELEYLNDYTTTNITAVQKIIKKFDKAMDTSFHSTFWPIVKSYRFVKSETDERLLFEAVQLWRKCVPPAPLVPTKNISLLKPEVPTVNTLDLESFPRGKLHRVWVALAEDGLSLPIKVPILIARGIKGENVVGITAALHGNELNGIPLIHRLYTELDPSQLHGTVVAVLVVNVPGYLQSIRNFDGVDLNRLMPGKKHGSTPQVYAYNLMQRIISKFNYLLDLHTASKGRVNSLYVRANMNDKKTRKMAILQNPQIIVHNTSPDGSLRGSAMELDIPAITVEIGDPSRFQKRFIRNALVGVTNILSNLKMIQDDTNQISGTHTICTKSYWIFAKQGGIINVIPDVNTWVKKDEPIATLYNIFGDLEHTYHAPEDGIVIGKNIDPVCKSGNRILHLGVVDAKFPEVVDDGHL